MNFKPVAFAAVGVLLGRGAQADTILTFDALPAGQVSNAEVLQTFGDNAAASSEGVQVNVFGTPNIGLTWSGTGAADARWDYYIDSVWSAGQLNRSILTATHDLRFSPTPGWAVAIRSFNFHPYYTSAETFEYTWRVMDGANVLSSGNFSFGSDATKNHLVTVNYTGNPGQEIALSLLRTGGSGDSQNIAVDDIIFAQVPEPGTLSLLALGGLAALTWATRRRRFLKAGADR